MTRAGGRPDLQGGALWREDAPAKVNLFLHITGRREDGYHLLQSLFVYLDLADRLQARLRPQGGEDLLEIRGPQADRLHADDPDNLVLRALRLLRSHYPALPPLAVTLDKFIPVAAGLGGGSADAAAALRIGRRVLAEAAGIRPDDAAIARLARELGADVPPALESRACWVEGIGERVRLLEPVPALTGLAVLLVNPGVAVATADIFRGWRKAGRPFRPALQMPAGVLEDASRLARWLGRRTTNDLEPIAKAAAPAVSTALDLLAGAGSCLLARMSGSGATCFGLFTESAAAARAQRAIAAAHPDWWTTLARVDQSWQGNATRE